MMVSRLGCMLGENARHGLSVGQGTREWSACALSVKLYRRQRGAVRRARSPRHMGKASRTAGKRGRLPGCHVKDSSGRGAVAAGRWRVDPASPSFGVVNRSAPSLLALGLALAALLPSVLEAKVAAIACLPVHGTGRVGWEGRGRLVGRAERLLRPAGTGWWPRCTGCWGKGGVVRPCLAMHAMSCWRRPRAPGERPEQLCQGAKP